MPEARTYTKEAQKGGLGLEVGRRVRGDVAQAERRGFRSATDKDSPERGTRGRRNRHAKEQPGARHLGQKRTAQRGSFYSWQDLVVKYPQGREK